MVSQSSSVGYTIMGRLLTWQLSKRRPLTPCTRRARHKRSLQKRLAVHRALCPSTLIERRREGKDVVEKSVQAIGITAPWRGLWNKTHSKMWGRFTKSGLQLESVLQEPLRTDVCKTWVSAVAFLVSSTLEQQTASEASRLDCCWVVQSNVSDESKFCISFGNQGPRVWRKRGEAQNPCCLRSSVKFPQSVMVLGCHVICWCWSTVFSEVQGQHSRIPGSLEHFMLPAADQLYGDADFISNRTWHLHTVPKLPVPWFKDHGIPVLNWPANSPDLNPIENLWGIVKRKMRYARPNNAEELKAHYQSNLGSHNTWAVPQTDRLHATPHCCSNSGKRSPN